MELDTPVIDRLKQMELDLPPLYQLLNHDRQEIRLLRILPPQPDCKDICCLLEVASLSTYLFYRALSYEWGPPDDKYQVPATRVFLNSHFVTTTPNLRLALAHLLNEQAWFWIDALGINQSDDDERAQQVSMMTRIYEQAFGIDVWLGPEEGNSAEGMRFIGDAAVSLADADTEIYASEWRADWMKAALTNSEYESSWAGLHGLTSRTYWKRLWIIQELVANPLPERIQLRCGEETVSLPHMLQLLHPINKLSWATPLESPLPWAELVRKLDMASIRVQMIGLHVHDWAREGSDELSTDIIDRLSILSLLAEYHRQQCVDPRDKIYALLGISHPYDGAKLDISYSISVEQLYLDVAKHIIHGSRRLDILLFCRRASLVVLGTAASINLPSWVPDWRRIDRAKRVIRPKWEKWEASGPDSNTVVSYFNNYQVLVVSGWIIGSISRYQHQRECVEAERGDKLLPSIQKLMRILLDFAAETLQTPVGKIRPLIPTEDTIQLLHRTIVQPAYGVERARHKLSYTNLPAFCASLYPSPDSQPHTSSSTSTAEAWAHEAGVELFTCNNKVRRLCAIIISTDFIPGVKTKYPRMKTIGLGSHRARKGDVVAIVKACRNPVVLRLAGETGLYQLIDECFVYEFMNGEALQMFPEVELRIK